MECNALSEHLRPLEAERSLVQNRSETVPRPPYRRRNRGGLPYTAGIAKKKQIKQGGSKMDLPM